MGLLNICQNDVTIHHSSYVVVDIVVSPDGSNAVRNVQPAVTFATKISTEETNGPVGN
jgi:hypothetical protein